MSTQSDVDASQDNSETKAKQQSEKNDSEISNSTRNSGEGYEKPNKTTLLKEKLNGSVQRNATAKEEKLKKIRRLDLKAYGFNNEFNMNGGRFKPPSQQRVVNKLNLSLFGFDGGLKKAQSTYHLNSRESYNDDQMSRSESTRVLSRYNKDSDISKRISMFDRDKESNGHTKSNFSGLYYSNGIKSAESVPNISGIDHYNSSPKFTKYDRGDVSKFILARRDNWRNSCDTLDSKAYSSSDDISIEESSVKNYDEKMSSEEDSRVSLEKELPMPSVKRLAETFNQTPKEKAPSVSKVSKAANYERAKTPEIQIIETPKQMHSLTARSLSKEFREGLRQIPSKVASFPVRQIKHEEQIAENEVFTNHDEKGTDIISPGKLRDNIQFWEQLQKQS